MKTTLRDLNHFMRIPRGYIDYAPLPWKESYKNGGIVRDMGIVMHVKRAGMVNGILCWIAEEGNYHIKPGQTVTNWRMQKLTVE